MSKKIYINQLWTEDFLSSGSVTYFDPELQQEITLEYGVNACESLAVAIDNGFVSNDDTIVADSHQENSSFEVGNTTVNMAGSADSTTDFSFYASSKNTIVNFLAGSDYSFQGQSTVGESLNNYTTILNIGSADADAALTTFGAETIAANKKSQINIANASVNIANKFTTLGSVAVGFGSQVAASAMEIGDASATSTAAMVQLTGASSVEAQNVVLFDGTEMTVAENSSVVTQGLDNAGRINLIDGSLAVQNGVLVNNGVITITEKSDLTAKLSGTGNVEFGRGTFSGAITEDAAGNTYKFTSKGIVIAKNASIDVIGQTSNGYAIQIFAAESSTPVIVTVYGTLKTKNGFWVGSDDIAMAASASISTHKLTVSGSDAVAGSTSNAFYVAQSAYVLVEKGAKLVSPDSNIHGYITVNGTGSDYTATHLRLNGETGTRAQMVISDNATMTVKGNFNIGHETQADRAADVTLKTGANFTAGNILISADAAIKMDALSALTVTGALTNNGTVSIDASAWTAGTKKVVDLGSISGTAISVTGLTGAMKAFYGEDGDVVLSDASLTNLKVNAAWAENYAFGDAIQGADGYFYGINAFSTVEKALSTVAPANVLGEAWSEAVTIDMTDATSGKLDLYGKNLILTGKLTSDGTWNTALVANSATDPNYVAKLVLDGAEIQLTGYATLEGVNWGRAAVTFDKNGNVVASADQAVQRGAIMELVNGTVFNLTNQVNGRGIFFKIDGTSSITQYGNQNALITMTSGAVIDGGIETAGTYTTTKQLDTIRILFGKGSGEWTGVYGDKTYFTFKNGANVEATGMIEFGTGSKLKDMDVEINASKILSGGDILIGSEENAGKITSFVVANQALLEAAGTITVTGTTVALSDSTLKAASVVNNGTINASGAVDLSGTFTGNAIAFASGAKVTSTTGFTGNWTNGLTLASGDVLSFGSGSFDFNMNEVSGTMKLTDQAQVTTGGAAGFTAKAGSRIELVGESILTVTELYGQEGSSLSITDGSTLKVAGSGYMAAGFSAVIGGDAKQSVFTIGGNAGDSGLLGGNQGNTVIDIKENGTFNALAGLVIGQRKDTETSSKDATVNVYAGGTLNVERQALQVSGNYRSETTKAAGTGVLNIKGGTVNASGSQTFGSDTFAMSVGGLAQASTVGVGTGTVTLTDGGTLNVIGTAGLLIRDNGSVSITQSSALYATSVSNAGSIAMDASGLFVAGSLTNGGSFSIDASAWTAGTKKIVDLDSFTGTAITVTGLTGDMKVFTNAEGDVVLSDASMEKMLVDATWSAGYKFGDAIQGVDGYYFGINAFESVQAAANAVSGTETTQTISIADGVYDATKFTKSTIVTGTATFDLTASEGLMFYTDGVAAAVYEIAAGSVFTAPSLSLRAENAAGEKIDGLTVSVNCLGTVNLSGGADDSAREVWVRKNTELTIGKSGSVSGATQISNRGTINVLGELRATTIQGNGSLNLAGASGTAGVMNIDGGSLIVEGVRTIAGGASIKIGEDTTAASGRVVLSNGGKITAVNSEMYVGTQGELVLNDGSVVTIAGMQNDGTLTVNSGSSVFADSMTGSGTIELSFDSKLTIGGGDGSNMTVNADLSGYTGGRYCLLSWNGFGSENFVNITVEPSPEYEYSVIYTQNGFYIYDKSSTVVHVNSIYADEKVAFEAGYLPEVEAFADVDSALFSSQDGTTICFGSNSGTAGKSYYANGKNLTLQLESGVEAVRLKGDFFGGCSGSSSTPGTSNLTVLGGDYANVIYGGGRNWNSKGLTLNVDGATSANRIYGGGLYDVAGTYTEGDINVTIGKDVKIADRYGSGKVNAGILTTGDVTVNFHGSATKAVYGGAQAWYNGTVVTHKSVTLNFDGTTERINGAGVAAGATLKITDGVRVNVTGGKIAGDALMAGGIAQDEAGIAGHIVITKSADRDYAVELTISNGAFIDAEVTGGAHTWSNGGKITNTAEIIGGTFVSISGGATICRNIYGGNYNAWGGSTKLDKSTVVIGEATIYQGVYGGSKNVGGGSSGTLATVGETNVTINAGANILGDVAGGGYVNWISGQGTSQVTGNSVVTVSGGTIAGNLIGGGVAMASIDDGASSSLRAISGNTEVNLTGGYIGGNVYGGSVADNSAAKAATVYGSVTGDVTVTISGTATVAGSVYGGGNVFSDSTSGNAASIVEGDVAINIFGGTIKGNVFAGGSASGNSDVAQSVIKGKSVITISDGIISGGIYGKGQNGATIEGDAVLNFTNTSEYTLSSSAIAGFDSVVFKGNLVTFTGAADFTNSVISVYADVAANADNYTFVNTSGNGSFSYSGTSFLLNDTIACDQNCITIVNGSTYLFQADATKIGMSKVNIDTTTLYVDAAYAGSKYGESLGDGKYYGYNAIGNIDQMYQAFEDGSFSTVALGSDVELSTSSHAGEFWLRFASNVKICSDSTEVRTISFSAHEMLLGGMDQSLVGAPAIPTITIGENVLLNAGNSLWLGCIYDDAVSYPEYAGNFAANIVLDGDIVVTSGQAHLFGYGTTMTVSETGSIKVINSDLQTRGADLIVNGSGKDMAEAQIQLKHENVEGISGSDIRGVIYDKAGASWTLNNTFVQVDTSFGINTATGSRASGIASNVTLNDAKLTVGTNFTMADAADLILNAASIVTIGGNLLVGNGVAINTGSTVSVNAASSLTVNGVITIDGGNTLAVNASSLDAASIVNAGNITVDGSAVLAVSGILDNSGSLVFDYDAAIRFGGFGSNAGSITINGTTSLADGLYKVMDYTGNGTLTVDDYQTQFGTKWSEYTFTVIESDLYLVKGQTGVVYYDIAWTGYQHGEAFVVDGTTFYYGINAFNSLEGAKATNPSLIVNYGGKVENETPTGFDGSPALIESGSTFDKNAHVYGGNAAADDTIANDSDLTINGGTFGGFVSGGNHVQASDNLTMFDGNAKLTISDGEFKRAVVGAGHVESGIVRRTGNVTTAISGGTFAVSVAGGIFLNTNGAFDIVNLKGNIDLTISGGTFGTRVYGGNLTSSVARSAQAVVDGDINLTIDSSVNTISFADHIIAGSSGAGGITGNVTVTIKGSGDNLDFNKTLLGGSEKSYYQTVDGKRICEDYVDGTTNLIFSDFTGTFNGKINVFESIAFNANTNVVFANTGLNLSDISDWSFQFGSAVAGIAKNNFSGDNVSFDLTGWDDQTTAWDAMSGSVATFAGVETMSVLIGGEAAIFDGISKWSSSSYKLELLDGENGDKKFVISLA